MTWCLESSRARFRNPSYLSEAYLFLTNSLDKTVDFKPYSLQSSRARFANLSSYPKPIFSLSVLFIKVFISRHGPPEL